MEVFVSPGLKLSPHASNKASKSIKAVSFVWMLQKSTCCDFGLWNRMYISPVRTHLKFASFVCNPYRRGDITALSLNLFPNPYRIWTNLEPYLKPEFSKTTRHKLKFNLFSDRSRLTLSGCIFYLNFCRRTFEKFEFKVWLRYDTDTIREQSLS